MTHLFSMVFFLSLFIGCADSRDLHYGSLSFSLDDFETRVDSNLGGNNQNLVLSAEMPINSLQKKTSLKNEGVSPAESTHFSNAWYDYWIKDVDTFSIIQIYDKNVLRNLAKKHDETKIIPSEYRLVLQKQHYLANGWIGHEQLQSIPIDVKCTSLPLLKSYEDHNFYRHITIVQPKGRCNFSKTNATFTLRNGNTFRFDFHGYYDQNESNTGLNVTIEKITESKT